MVVPVLITSCHVSEKWKNGPDTAHTAMVTIAKTKVKGCPTAREVLEEIFLKVSEMLTYKCDYSF